MSKSGKVKPRIGGAVYILPNLLTTGNIYFGFLSVIKSLQGDYGWAAGAIILASIFDVLDGRVARLTNGTSEFGVQYDSLCDLISFGIAPAILVYQYGLHHFGRIGWVLSFVFLACGALRLARFNVASAIGKADGDFTGLPIPMAAAVIACFVALQVDLDNLNADSPGILFQIKEYVSGDHFRRYFLAFVTPSLAGMMVSNVAYRSHKSLNFHVVKPFSLLAFLVLSIGIAAYQPELIGFFFFFLYALSGPLEWIIGSKKLRNDDDIFSPLHEDDSIMEPKDNG